MERET